MEKKFIEQLKDILEIENIEVNMEDKFRDYENWDSMAALSVIAMIDDEFGVVINGEDFRQLNTVGDLVQAIKKRMP
jgi:acyl carrier protein